MENGEREREVKEYREIEWEEIKIVKGLCIYHYIAMSQLIILLPHLEYHKQNIINITCITCI